MGIFAHFIQDQIRFSLFAVRPHTRPGSAEESAEKLKLFKTDYGKVQFLNNVKKWVLFDPNYDFMLAESEKYDGIVRDSLLQLVEIWEDSSR